MKKYYIVCCQFHHSYVCDSEEQARELLYNDPAIPDDLTFTIKSISDCSNVDDDWSIGEKGTARVIKYLQYEEDYDQIVLNSLMQVTD